MAQIGRPLREIVVEPLTLPVPTREPAATPTPAPPLPVQVPA
jgi:hypothetical protein